ncbi:radical SAM protein [Allocoprobacillus halotolerans]|uniref:Radical SAM protein n=1 Tax=Allocoprobacillus halotolerans TaxID=2944914 RepID=A0ABY5I3X7_9FIRM|nr:radical SAM protein [Allocoprobacillus halotolerans]UTY40062.1 radical SAM protein [Allocoprobacillus halotolerans]
MGTIKEKTMSVALKKVNQYIEKNPEQNIPKILDWLDKFDTSGMISSQLSVVRDVLNDQDNNWTQLVYSLYTDIDKDVRAKLFENFIINAVVLGLKQREEVMNKYQCNVPWAILLDPTSACNLKCVGCWASEYGHQLHLTYDEIDDIIEQGKKLGVYMYIYTGGEPMMRKKDLIKLCEKHNDCVFLTFTNATLIDEAFIKDMLRVKNFVPSISIEGNEYTTDLRRGQGTYQKVIKAMKLLKDNHLPFGVSCCYTSQNVEVLSSEEFMDSLIDFGAKFAWFFHYMPVGNDAVTDLLCTPEQRVKMYHQIRKMRNEKPIFTIDFQNDGEYVGGCIAGGRNYFHINPHGDIEPCVFIHYSDSNIREKVY